MLDILAGLNPQQKEAVIHTGTPLLLLAGAGSGKTRVLTHRAAYFVKDQHATPDQILLLTFTNKAAGEMKQRMNTLLSDFSKTSTDGLFAGTFHSFCCRVLRQDGHHIGISPDFVIYDSSDQENLVKQILFEKELTIKEFKPSSVLYFIEDAKNHYLKPKEVAQSASGFWAKIASDVYTKYQQRLDEYSALDFNDLLFKTVDLFSSHPEVLAKYHDKYRYILVDEYQDTNQIQYLMTKMLAAKYKQITAVGDASQAIYGWRGADYKNLVSFTTDFSDSKVINLEQNYRSTKVILDAANSVISKNSSHPILKLFTNKSSNDKIKIFQADSEITESQFVASKIKFIHDNMQIPYKNIAVLYRMNTQSRVLEEAFLKQSIPYVLIGGTKFYERAEVKDIVSMLRIIVDDKDRVSSDRVTKALGKRRRQTFDNLVASINLSQQTTLDVLENIVVNSGYLQKFDPKLEEDQRRIENIKELKSVAASFPKITDFLENIALVQQEYSLQEKNKKKENQEGVRLMTLHSSKGLEFEVVFLVGFEEGILPHSRCFVNPEEVEEERRLCYVGITRAKDYLYISYATQRLYFGKSSLNEPSRFLVDIPADLVEYEENPDVVRDYRHRSHQDSSDSDFVYDPDIY